MNPGTWRDPPLLGERDVLIVRPRADGEEDFGAEGRSWLSAAERGRAEGFRRDLDRSRLLLRTAFLRGVLGTLTGLDPASLRFETGEHGKPRLDPAQAGELRFNLSHSHGEVLLAVSHREVGVDLERRAPLEDLDRMAERILHPEELGPWRALEGEERIRAFFRAWTRKEAALKAVGAGFSREPATIQVGLEARSPGEPWAPPDPTMRSFGALADLGAPEGYAAAVCAAGEDWRVVIAGE